MTSSKKYHKFVNEVVYLQNEFTPFL